MSSARWPACSVSSPGVSPIRTSPHAVTVWIVGILIRVTRTRPHAHLGMPVSVFRYRVVTSWHADKYMSVSPKSQRTFLHTSSAHWVSVVSLSSPNIKVAVQSGHTDPTDMMTILISGRRTLRHTFEGSIITKITKRTLLNTEIADIVSIAIIRRTVVPTLRHTGLSCILCIGASRTYPHASVCWWIRKGVLLRRTVRYASPRQIVSKLTIRTHRHALSRYILCVCALCAPKHASSCMRVSVVVDCWCT